MNSTLPQVIEPGQVAVATVQLTCTVAGSQNALLTLDVQSALGPVSAPAVVVDGSCGIRGYALSPNALDYGKVLFNSSFDRTVALTNTGFETLTVTALTSSFPAFTVVSPLISLASPLVLGASGSSTITIRLSCVNATQTQSGSLSLSATTPSGPVPCGTVSLLGECVVQNPQPNPDPVVGCSVTPTVLAYGAVGGGVGGTGDATFTIQNTGNIAMQVTGLTSTSAAYAVLSPAATPVLLGPGGVATVTIRFTCPVAAPVVTAGTINITATTALGPLVCAPVTMTGTCPA